MHQRIDTNKKHMYLFYITNNIWAQVFLLQKKNF